MAKARDIILGATQRRPCTVTAIDGTTQLRFALALLTSSDTAAIAAGAREYARGKGVAEPRADDPLFLRGKHAHTLLRACVDPDITDRVEPYWDDVSRIERMLDDAAQVYVVQEQRDFQDEFSPLAEGCTPEQAVQLQAAIVDELRKGGDPESPLRGLPARTLRSFSTRLVAMHLPLRELLSELGSRARASTTTSPSTAPDSETKG